MGWLSPSVMERRPGTPGVIRILADVSDSISPKNKARIMSEAVAIIRAHRQARLIAFAYKPLDITHDPSQLVMPLWDCYAPEGMKFPGNIGTFIGRALALAARDNPDRTIVLSDGGAADKRELFRIADAMTGRIDAYFCEPRREEYNLENYYATPDQMYRAYTNGTDKGVMQELARRGGGRFSPYPSYDGIRLDRGAGKESPMAHERKVFVTGPKVNIQTPQTEVHRVTRRIDLYHDAEVHHHYGETRHIHHGEPEDIEIQSGQAQVSVQRPDGVHAQHHEAPAPPRSFWSAFLLGPRREVRRGTLREAPALAPPSKQPGQAIAYFSKAKVR